LIRCLTSFAASHSLCVGKFPKEAVYH